MPFYEYTCQGCGKDFEVFVRTMNAKAPHCPECGGAKTTRKLSVFGVSSGQSQSPAPSGCGGCAQSRSCPMAR